MHLADDDAADVTVAATIDDYRDAAYQSSAFGWLAGLIGILATGAIASWVASQTIGAVVLGLLAFGLLCYVYVGVNARVRRMPAWALGPYIYRLADDGLAISGASGTRLIRWGAIASVQKTPLAYWFIAHAGNRIPLFRRALSSPQEESIDAALARLAGRIGEPI